MSDAEKQWETEQQEFSTQLRERMEIARTRLTFAKRALDSADEEFQEAARIYQSLQILVKIESERGR